MHMRAQRLAALPWSAALDVTTDARHLAQDMDAELEKSRALLAELFPEDADPLGLGDS